ncbi:MAG TPA: type II and III secretion system protein [Sedimentisphaerales bacterium]|jgi:general secretion pathway protein D|nr:type II and III secretion system protein [Sedimentisphaerales bacterium]HNU27841.1 type II and III secretion system protein [Sedimentisphaerales bacterium]
MSKSSSTRGNAVRFLLASRLTASLAILSCVCGCKDVERFFDRTAIDNHSRDLIREMGNIEPIPDVNAMMDGVYTGPPEIVTNAKGTFIFYNTKYQSPATLTALLKDTLGVTVCSNTKINQCVIKCESEDNARVVIEFLDRMDKRPIQVEIDCLVSEVYADLTLDYETTLAIEDLFGTGDGGIKKVGDVLADAIEITGTLPGASNRDVDRADMGINFGLSSHSGSFSAMIDMLVSRGYMQVVMRPKLKVVNGQKASIKTSDSTPITKTVTAANVEPYQLTEYTDVTDSLEVTPNVYADGSIGLATKVVLGSTDTPSGVSQKTIITTRTIEVAENLVRPGRSLVIGGLRKTEKVGITRGVPFLMDIPFLGILFSSKDYETSAKEILFILTPTISDMGEDHHETMEMIRRKHAEKEQDGFLSRIYPAGGLFGHYQDPNEGPVEEPVGETISKPAVQDAAPVAAPPAAEPTDASPTEKPAS